MTIKEQGKLLDAALYYGGSAKTYSLLGDATEYNLYRTSSVTVTKQGNACPKMLYYKSSSGAYLDMGETMYYAGSSATYYNRTLYASKGDLYHKGNDVTVYIQGEEYTSPLYEPGSSVTIKKQGNLLDTALYHEGTAYSGGLYSGFTPATITTKDITALTI